MKLEPRPTFDVQLGIRITSEEHKRIDAVAKKFPRARRADVVREALRCGLDVIETATRGRLSSKSNGSRK